MFAELTVDFGITSSLVGFVISMAYLPYVLMQIPCGILTDKAGAKIMATVGFTMCSIGVLIFGMATSVFQLELGRFIIGFSSAAAYLCCGKITNTYFDKQKYAFLMGWAAGVGSLGSMLGTTPVSLLTNSIGWRNTTYVLAALGICLAILAFLVMPADTEREKTNGNTDLFVGLRMLLKNPAAWLLGVYGCILFVAISALAELWIIPFMEARFNVPTERASLSSIALFLGFIGGNLLSAWVAAKIGGCKKIMIVCSTIFTLTLWMAIFSDTITYNTCLMLLLITGTMAGSNIFSFSLAYDIVPERYGGTAVGFMNAIIMLGGVIFQPLLGSLLDFFRNGTVDGSGHPIYTIETYRMVFTVVIIGAIMAVISVFFIKDSKQRAYQEES